MSRGPLSPEDFEDVRAEFTDAPLERARTIPSAWFVEPRFEGLDREAVFAGTWQSIGHVGNLREPGSWIVGEVAGEPIIAVNGSDGVLRAFFNVCRHRGGPLAMCDGSGGVLKCRYHGWTYTLDGILRGVPQWDRVELFDRRDYGLMSIRIETWNGLVFVNLDPGAAALSDLLQGIDERLAPVRLEDFRHEARVVYDVRSNWKVYVENFLEGYHVPIVHPELVKLYDYSNYSTEVHDNYTLQASPLEGADRLGLEDGEALYYCVFPNFMLNILPGRLQTNNVVPTGPESCRVTFDYFYADADSTGGRARAVADMSFADEVQAEDIEICEYVQRGLASRAYDRGRFSVKFEAGVHWFQRRLCDAYGRWLTHGSTLVVPPVLDPVQGS